MATTTSQVDRPKTSPRVMSRCAWTCVYGFKVMFRLRIVSLFLMLGTITAKSRFKSRYINKLPCRYNSKEKLKNCQNSQLPSCSAYLKSRYINKLASR